MSREVRPSSFPPWFGHGGEEGFRKRWDTHESQEVFQVGWAHGNGARASPDICNSVARASPDICNSVAPSTPNFAFWTYSTSRLKVYVPFQENDRFTANRFIKKRYYYGKETQQS